MLLYALVNKNKQKVVIWDFDILFSYLCAFHLCIWLTIKLMFGKRNVLTCTQKIQMSILLFTTMWC
jgi:hypothetical protein